MKHQDSTVLRHANRSGPMIVGLVLGLGLLLIAVGTLPYWSDLLSPDRDALPVADEVSTVVVEEPETVAQTATEEVADATAEMDVDALVEAYNNALARDDLTVALRAAHRYVAVAPQDAYGYAMRGYAQWMRSRCDLAVADLTRAIELNDAYGYAYWARGSCRLVRGDLAAATEDAAAAFLRAGADGERFEARMLTGWIGYSQGRFADAQAAFTVAARLDESSTDAEIASRLAAAGAGDAFEIPAPRSGPVSPNLETGDIDRHALGVLDGTWPAETLLAAAVEEPVALFYAAQIALFAGEPAMARDLLQDYVGGGFDVEVRWAVAKAQLRALR